MELAPSSSLGWDSAHSLASFRFRASSLRRRSLISRSRFFWLVDTVTRSEVVVGARASEETNHGWCSCCLITSCMTTASSPEGTATGRGRLISGSSAEGMLSSRWYPSSRVLPDDLFFILLSLMLFVSLASFSSSSLAFFPCLALAALSYISRSRSIKADVFGVGRPVLDAEVSCCCDGPTESCSDVIESEDADLGADFRRRSINSDEALVGRGACPVAEFSSGSSWLLSDDSGVPSSESRFFSSSCSSLSPSSPDHSTPWVLYASILAACAAARASSVDAPLRKASFMALRAANSASSSTIWFCRFRMA
mmetsp:Transcript_16427/g.37766  ORF Transcript_16427/g.37766 Transcript_16427/m.37766 type:complete len:310 (-) Transcript_16427:187-1116(-)